MKKIRGILSDLFSTDPDRDRYRLIKLSGMTLGHEMLFFGVLVGLAAGLAAIGFYWLLDTSVHVFLQARPSGLTPLSVLLILLFPAFGGLVCGILLQYFAPDARGGVPEVIDAVLNRDGLVRRRVWIFKTLASAICIGSGGSAGREGPVVQIGASVGSTLARAFSVARQQSKLLTACGAAGGIAAVFNAPVGGAFFAAEIVMGEFEMRDMTLLFSASAMGATVARIFLQNRAAFSVPPYQPQSVWELLFQPIVGIGCALVGHAFISGLHESEARFAKLSLHPVLKPALGGLLVGAIGLFIPQVFGTGGDVLGNIFVNPVGPLLLLLWMAAKLVATSLTLGSGGSGGDLMPSLFLGGALGGAIGHFLHHFLPALTMPPGAYALIGAAALFAAVAHAPVTAIILGFEMGGNYSVILPLMIACSIAALVSRRIRAGSLYTMKLQERGIDVERLRGARHDPLDAVHVSEVMDPKIDSVSPDLPIKELFERFSKTGHHGFLVLKDGNLAGIVTLSDAQKALGPNEINKCVSDIATWDPVVCYPSDTLNQAWERIGNREVGRLPVVSPEDPARALGVLHRSDILRGYSLGLERIRPRE